jgi:hypothetical protein
MNKQNKPLLVACKWLITSTALASSTPVFSEYYMAVDATYMEAKTIFGNGTTRFELAPARIKFGQRFEEFGWEIQALTPSDDTDPFPGGSAHQYELRHGIGIQLTASTPGRGFYGGIGFTQIRSDYSILVNGLPIASTTTDTPFTTINLGAQYEFSKNARITFDYTFYHGDIDCTFCVPNPNLPANFINSNPDVRLSTFALGLSYSF